MSTAEYYTCKCWDWGNDSSANPTCHWVLIDPDGYHVAQSKNRRESQGYGAGHSGAHRYLYTNGLDELKAYQLPDYIGRKSTVTLYCRPEDREQALRQHYREAVLQLNYEVKRAFYEMEQDEDHALQFEEVIL